MLSTAALLTGATDSPPDLAAFLSPASQAGTILPVTALLLAALYVSGVVRLRWHRRRWSLVRSVCFLLGCAILFLTTGSGVESYGRELLSVFIFQQLTLMMIVPPLVLLGAPGTLLLRATPHSVIGRPALRGALGALRSRTARRAFHPTVFIPLLLVTFFGLYPTGVASGVLSSRAGHIALEICFLAIGLFLNAPLISPDPLPRRTSPIMSIVDRFAEMQIHAAFGLVMIFAPTILVSTYASPPPTWGIDALRDQALAGAFAWTYGELPVIVMLIIALVRWQKSDTRRSNRSRAEEEDALSRYNDYLQRLK